MSNNNDMIKLVRLIEGQEFAGEKVGQKPGDQVRGTDQARVGGKDHPFKGRLVGEDTALEDVISKKYSDFKDVQAKEKAEKEKAEEEKDKKKELDESVRLIGRKNVGNRSVSFYRDTEWNEFVVQFFVDGAHQEDADYHTDDKQDAFDTAANWLKGGGVTEASWNRDPEQEKMDATRRGRLRREREPAGSEAIDARLRAQNDQLAQYNQSGKFWLKRKDTQEHISDAVIGKAAANAAALELLKQQPELRGNIVITAYGPGESRDVAEGNDHSLKKVWDRYARHLEAGRGDHSDVRQIYKSGDILRNIRKYVKDHYGQKAVDDMERYAEKRIWGESVAEGKQRMSRAAKGHEKYGKEGMAALAKAGREGKDLDKIRDEYNKYDDSVTEGMLDNPGQEDSPVAQAIIRRILMQRTDLLAKHGPEKVGAAVDEVADFVGDVDEIGSSDVSGWVRHVEQMLGNMEESSQITELGATHAAPPAGTATTTPGSATGATPSSSAVSPDEQVALNKINQTPAMKQQLDKLMTQAVPGQANKPMALDPEQQKALERIKANAGLGSQYAKLIAQANPGAAKP